MKYSVQQLRKIMNFPYHFEFTCDFKDDIKDVEDILDIDTCYVKGDIIKIDDDTFEFDYHLTCKLTMACSLTLKEVDYLIDDDFQETFSVVASEDYTLIENNTIDLNKVAYSTIIIARPIRIVRDDAYEILKELGIDIQEG